jgi:long-chain acyl-CoA synthetase
LREFTNPPLALAPPVGGLADVVFEHARRDPLYVALSR